MSSNFDESKHPRGQPDNPGQFKRKPAPEPPKATPRQRQSEAETPRLSHTDILEMGRQVGEAASTVGLGGRYDLIDAGTNDVFRSEEAQCVARVAPEYQSPEDVQSIVLASGSLANDSGAPLLPPLTHRVVELARGRAVSFWPLAEPEPKPDAGEVAAVLAAFHAVEGPPRYLTEWTPSVTADRRLAQLDVGIRRGLPQHLEASLRCLLEDATVELKARLDVGPNGPAVACHGDTHHLNFVRHDGALMLCDPDNICRGPRELDLANIVDDCRSGRLGLDHWGRVNARYPHAYDWYLLELLVRLQQVGGCMWLAQFWPEKRDELLHCLSAASDDSSRRTFGSGGPQRAACASGPDVDRSGWR